MTGVVRAGVIGAGVFGGYHAQKWAAMDGASLAAIYDTHADRAAALATRVGGEAYQDIAGFLEAVDVVSIASPAISHGASALQALKAGKHIYVEKPLAVTLDEADAIEAEAATRGLIVACGFAERVAIEAIGLYKYREAPRVVEATRFGVVEATRFGVASTRNQDVSVVLDLMIHDIDLALSLDAAAPLTVEAEGTAAANGLLDTARAEVTFSSGTVAILDASRVAEAPRRSLKLTYDSGMVKIDFLAGTLENTTRFDLNADFAAAPGATDRLGYSLGRFKETVLGAGRLVANVRDGVRALDLALAVEQAAARG